MSYKGQMQERRQDWRPWKRCLLVMFPGKGTMLTAVRPGVLSPMVTSFKNLNNSGEVRTAVEVKPQRRRTLVGR